MKKQLLILGGGESGVGTALLAKQMGFDVLLSDASSIRDSYRAELEQANIRFEENGHREAVVFPAEEVMKSPGIPEKAEIVQQLRAKGVRVISEMEFAGRYTNSKIIGITGSNGKSTCTTLLYHILKKANCDVAMGGNIGKSFARLLVESPASIYVLEISSFQLDDIRDFKCDLAVLLNITPDHLDRYHYQFEEYAAAKFKIVNRMTEQDAFIYCSDDEGSMSNISNYPIAAEKLAFSLTDTKCAGYTQNDTLFINYKTQTFNMPLRELSIKGKHNVYNSLAAGLAAKVMGIRNEDIRESLSDFVALPHRLEHVIKLRDVDFINDSKATNVNSTWYALESMTQPIVWIAGGVDKGNDYDILRPLVKERVKAIICLGLDNRALHKSFGNCVEAIVNTVTMKDAVKMAFHFASKGDAILLSPACASFDLFKNYEDRGDQFKQCVRSI